METRFDDLGMFQEDDSGTEGLAFLLSTYS